MRIIHLTLDFNNIHEAVQYMNPKTNGDVIALEVWCMLTDNAKKEMEGIKDSFIASIAADVEHIITTNKTKSNWISVKDKLPDCWSQHILDYGSGYLLGYTKCNDICITQLWKIKQTNGQFKNEWEGEEGESDYITHWAPLPKAPINYTP